MIDRSMQRREMQGERLHVLRVIGGADERRREKRWRGTRIAQSVRRLGFIDPDGVALGGVALGGG